MKLRVSLLLFVSLASVSCAQPTVRSVDQRQQMKLLRTAYDSGSKERLEEFFENWARETPALSDTAIENLSDTIRNTYLVFRQFYNPLNIQRTGGSEWGDDIYKKVNYLIIQPEIKIGFLDTLNRDTANPEKRYINWPKAKNYRQMPYFRPKLSFSHPKAIVLTGFYDSLLNAFLGNTNIPFASGNIMAPARSAGESQKRQQFLENDVKIFYGHWGGYWQLYSYPYVSNITFDKTFDNAVVNYRMVYEGGYAYFRKVNGAWTLIDAQRTWIE